jgi:hypothetical protein
MVVAGRDTAASGSRSPALETLIAPLRTHPTTGQSFRNGGGHLFRNPHAPRSRSLSQASKEKIDIAIQL